MFFSPNQFGFVHALESAWQVIRQECMALPGGEFDAWPEQHLYNQGWTVYGLFLAGKPMLENCIFCPDTTALLKTIPGIASAGFSRLAAGSEIHPHVGYSDQVLRLHLGLLTPADCALRVGPQTRNWQAGKCLVFDDTVEHAAWNRSDSDRIVLLVDFARPELLR
jgi:ornithine lipid ester-linked acyl 2-hydroxylase